MTDAPLGIRVGPLVVTIHAGEQVLVCQPDATVVPGRNDGYFVSDTRLVSNYHLSLSRARPVLLNSAATSAASARFEFVNDAIETTAGRLASGSVHLRLDRNLGGGIHEDYDLVSYAPDPVELDLEIRVEGDYADLFDVKGGHLVRRGALQTVWDEKDGALTTTYRNQDFHRGLRLQADRYGAPPEFANGTVSFRVRMQPRQRWHACLLWMPLLGDDPPSRPPGPCHGLAGDDPGDRHGRAWTEAVTGVQTDDAGVNGTIDRAVDDLASLRLPRHDQGTSADIAAADDADDADVAEAWVPAAGVPWFVSLFGRDALVASLQTLMLSPRFALAALRALAPLQAGVYDDAHDAQPGKIEHEIRHGELARLHLIPQTPYYGTHDATTLYVWAAGEVWRWLGDRTALEAIRPNVERALSWIDTDGDFDGDGLQEYQTRAGSWGYYNQGWKDSGDAIVDRDGSRAKLPIALCELQGYVVAAKRSWADAVEQAFEDQGGAERLRDEADRLAEAIEERFWWADEDTYYLGLDGDKRPIASVASNPGHLLWSGAVREDRAAAVVRRLLADDMWSGWGIRTLSSLHPSYNPFSYQCGSVWPHDNAILASGFVRYGHREEAAQVARGLFDAAERFQHSRLPEVFAGLERDPGSFPAQYLGANVPQAWASGAVLHLLSALAGVAPDAHGRRLVVAPVLPPWMGEVRLRGLRVGDASVDLRLTGSEGTVDQVRGELQVEVR